ncbi:hypothetical protein SERLA73DRAFT_143474 [Serpula lacrymans var. lacrymans S7.3]|uniref:Uncharacterized protein n=2 Tax=Serpula lacrymans var. lacrymans TaxID=341189 RepID=F8QA56_SERL3|nr:uncharacterized protein SERLADRAFT_400184 [Serpula lacrymans var. lacrymans S7.9]EGN94646.1 hypothetical protein SERLA73DRAFT_143474 [Serpula lacrymans var. lacrymans S7.3]EGO20127.1 hypothetical protein SERLADRAFT_400184 [Serpula lacrymans var. lacrymans S7.9]
MPRIFARSHEIFQSLEHSVTDSGMAPFAPDGGEFGSHFDFDKLLWPIITTPASDSFVSHHLALPAGTRDSAFQKR